MEKAVRIAGLGSDAVRVVEVDAATWRCARTRCARRIEADVAAASRPASWCATVGTTSTTAIDPLPAIGPICQEYGVWLHVDAAYAGRGRRLPRAAWLAGRRGVGRQLQHRPAQVAAHRLRRDAFWVADRAALIGALSILPEYLRNAATDAGAVIDYRDWQMPLGRRFRALKLWFVLRWYGAEGLRAHIRSRVALAAASSPAGPRRRPVRAGRAAPVSLVCLRLRGRRRRRIARDLLDRLNDGGEVLPDPHPVGGPAVLRVAVGSPATTRAHVDGSGRCWPRRPKTCSPPDALPRTPHPGTKIRATSRMLLSPARGRQQHP